MIDKELVANVLATCKERIEYANEVVKRINESKGEVKDEPIISKEGKPIESS